MGSKLQVTYFSLFGFLYLSLGQKNNAIFFLMCPSRQQKGFKFIDITFRVDSHRLCSVCDAE